MSSATLMLPKIVEGYFSFAKTLAGSAGPSSVGTGLIGWYLDTCAGEMVTAVSNWFDVPGLALDTLELCQPTLSTGSQKDLKKGMNRLIVGSALAGKSHMVRVCTSGYRH